MALTGKLSSKEERDQAAELVADLKVLESGMKNLASLVQSEAGKELATEMAEQCIAGALRPARLHLAAVIEDFDSGYPIGKPAAAPPSDAP